MNYVWSETWPATPGYYWYREYRFGANPEKGKIVEVTQYRPNHGGPYFLGACIGYNGAFETFDAVRGWPWKVEWSEEIIEPKDQWEIDMDADADDEAAYERSWRNNYMDDGTT